MRTITLNVPDELADQLAQLQDRLPELLALSLQQPAVPASIYRAILTFLAGLAGAPTPAQIAAFGPTSEMQQRLGILLERSCAGTLAAAEHKELDEMECIEHLVVMLKTDRAWATSLP